MPRKAKLNNIPFFPMSDMSEAFRGIEKGYDTQSKGKRIKSSAALISFTMELMRHEGLNNELIAQAIKKYNQENSRLSIMSYDDILKIIEENPCV